KEQNIDGIYLGTIDKFISAQYFYSNNGFREIKRGDLPSSFPKLDVDNRFYYRNLKD
ncbi:TPA: GNAT family N-acetyltransferase, partial [Staphylococcus aureus]|nr:GNAT family N-acetyltransferase [Staphylococcus aureus]NUY67123.1 GNAT family N-acetyltransferase [Staphylococcus aureus]HDP2826744.1 GNAT family N-acetyltransferase [Staphylococcus aureus]HDP3026031.1 GNAT family N-acetyltransferase [Staphylococcus aureus]HDP3183512.1 GNAT family N-acetyltransferase [Staphylococcus aureus]